MFMGPFSGHKKVLIRRLSLTMPTRVSLTRQHGGKLLSQWTLSTLLVICNEACAYVGAQTYSRYDGGPPGPVHEIC